VDLLEPKSDENASLFDIVISTIPIPQLVQVGIMDGILNG